MNDPEKSIQPSTEAILGRMIPGVYLIGCGVLLAYILAMILFKNGFSKNPADWGTLGDYFGGLMNPVISFATLMVAFAVWKQQKEELRQTKEALEEQAKTAEQQRQEQRFFDLLNVYYRAVDALRFDETTGGFGSPVYRQTFHGKDAVSQWLSNQGALHSFLNIKSQHQKSNDNLDTCVSSKKFLESLGREWQKSDQSNRFGALLRTIQLVFSTASMVLTQRQRPYLDLLKAQLSEGELSLIGYQLLFDQSSTSLRTLVEQFGLLEHMSNSSLRSALQNQLAPTAFVNTRDAVPHYQGKTPC